MNELRFEALSCTPNLGVSFYRTKVPGGWFVMAVVEAQVADDARGAGWKATKQVTHTLGLSFYPDPQHLWDGSSTG